MKQGITKDMILEFFDTVGYCSGACNALEYAVLSEKIIDPMSVLEWLKSIEKYDNQTGKDTITYDDLLWYSFLDFELNFADGQFDGEENTGYDLAADFLMSDYCSDEQFKWFINKLIEVNGPEDSKWCNEVKRDQANFLQKVNM